MRRRPRRATIECLLDDPKLLCGAPATAPTAISDDFRQKHKPMPRGVSLSLHTRLKPVRVKREPVQGRPLLAAAICDLNSSDWALTARLLFLLRTYFAHFDHRKTAGMPSAAPSRCTLMPSRFEQEGRRCTPPPYSNSAVASCMRKAEGGGTEKGSLGRKSALICRLI